MATTRQIEANRANAKKSTGPKTEAGKLRARQNSWKHGLTAEVVVTTSEDAEAFSEFREALMRQYDPEGWLECELVERIASLCWRLRRVPVFEAAILDYREDVILRNEEAQEERERMAEEERLERQALVVRLLEHARAERGEEIVDETADDEEDDSDGEDSQDAEEEDYGEGDGGATVRERSVKLGRALYADANCGNALGKLGRHETTLMNNLAKTLDLLKDATLDRQCAARTVIDGVATEVDENRLLTTKRT